MGGRGALGLMGVVPSRKTSSSTRPARWIASRPSSNAPTASVSCSRGPQLGGQGGKAREEWDSGQGTDLSTLAEDAVRPAASRLGAWLCGTAAANRSRGGESCSSVGLTGTEKTLQSCERRRIRAKCNSVVF